MSAILNRVSIGSEGVVPGDVRMESTDDLATITQPGYINKFDAGVQLTETDVITAVYGPTFIKQLFTPTIHNGVITLAAFGGGGSINGGANLGSGEGVFEAVSGSNLTFNSLVAGANISITPSAGELTIAAVGSGGGTITDGENIGVGQGHVFAAASGANLQFKSLVEGSGVVITESSDTVTIAAAPVSGGLTSLANLPGGEGVFTTTVGSVAQLKSFTAGTGIGISANADNIIITNTSGGGGGGFDYLHTYWLAQNGNDANDGLSIDSPKLTMGAIAALLVSGEATVLNIADAGTYPIASTFTVSCPLLINAPGATFNWSGAPNGNMFFLNTFSPLVVNAGLIDGTNTLQLFRGFSSCFLSGPGGYCNTVNTARIWEDAHLSGGVPQAIFNVSTDASGGSFVFKYAGQQVINATQLGAGQVSSLLTSGTGNSVVINASDFAGGLTGTADFNLTCAHLGLGFTNATTGWVNLNVAKCDLNITSASGTFSGSVGHTNFVSSPYLFNDNIFLSPLSLNSQPILGEIYDVYFITPSSGSWSFVPGNAGNPVQGSNQHLIITNTTGAITLPDGTGLPSGYRFTASQTVYSGAIVHTTGSDTMTGQNGITPGTTTCYTGAGKMEFINTTSNGSGGNTWAVVNCFTSNSRAQTNIFISQIIGNDSTADGNADSPFATINAALAYVIATYTTNPSYGINLVITDDAVYNEKLDFTGTSNIHLVGRTAEIIYASSGPGDNGFTSDSPQQFVSVAALVTSGGGDSVNYSGTGALILNVDVLGGGAINNNGTGFMFAQTYVLEGNTTNTGGAQFKYTTIQRSGVDGAGVIGISTSGASSTWTVNSDIVSTTGHITALAGFISADLDITSATGNIVASAGNINASSGNIQAFQGSLIAGTNGFSGQLQVYPTLMNSGFLNLKATANTANVVTALLNQATSIATAHRLPNVALSDATLLVSRLTQIDPMSDLIYFDTTVTAADLAGGASVSLIGTFFGGQYRVRELFINSQGTNFSGGGGDRNVQIDDGATVFSIIPAATIQALVNNRWGSTDVPFPASASINTLTNPGVNLNIRYNGGTADYAAGSVTISGAWEKVV